jgi:hypothetical protein
MKYRKAKALLEQVGSLDGKLEKAVAAAREAEDALTAARSRRDAELDALALAERVQADAARVVAEAQESLRLADIELHGRRASVAAVEAEIRDGTELMEALRAQAERVHAEREKLNADIEAARAKVETCRARAAQRSHPKGCMCDPCVAERARPAVSPIKISMTGALLGTDGARKLAKQEKQRAAMQKLNDAIQEKQGIMLPPPKVEESS